ncbi:calponin-3 [Striga asiatica]|uniref:Calponin-3 n=1 Tax=Striga asiatica TaxID=4170 RepID=A0A5A7RDQ0_STRAF|nr:calponin-3 [Striga asiatica]
MAPGNRKNTVISKASLQSLLNQAAKDSSTAASARIGVKKLFNQSNMSSDGVARASRTTEGHNGSSGDNTTGNHTNESGIPQTLEAPNQNLNLDAAEGSTGNLQETSVKANHTNESGIPQTLEAPNQNLNLDAAEGSTGNLQEKSVKG